MKILFTAIIASLLFSCAPPRPQLSVEPEFRPYLEAFNKLYGVNSFVTINKAYLSDDTIGQCYLSYEKRSILIDIDYWNEADDYAKEELMYHELGHCILEREHDDSLDSEECPASIMNSFAIDPTCYRSKRYKYLVELGQNRKDRSVKKSL